MASCVKRLRPGCRAYGSVVEAPSWLLVLLALESAVGMAASQFGSATPSVQAYIDPGSGALLVQVLLSGLVGFLLYLKRVREFLRRLLPRSRRVDGKPSGLPRAE